MLQTFLLRKQVLISKVGKALFSLLLRQDELPTVNGFCSEKSTRAVSLFFHTSPNTQRRPEGFQFDLRESPPREMRSWTHRQSLVRFQTDRGIYSDVVSVNGRGECKDSGEDQQESKGEIRKGAKQASTAAIGVMNDDFALLERAPAGVTPPDTGRLYFPVITTAAKVSVLDISADQINEHGILPNVDNIDRREVPWAIYRWSLPRFSGYRCPFPRTRLTTTLCLKNTANWTYPL